MHSKEGKKQMKNRLSLSVLSGIGITGAFLVIASKRIFFKKTVL